MAYAGQRSTLDMASDSCSDNLPRMNCRLLYLIGQLGPGGSERQLWYLLEGMDRKRYQPVVVVWNYCERDPYVSKIRDLGVPLYALPGTTSRAVKLGALRRMVRQMRPEVVHSYTSFTNFAAWLATLGQKTLAIGSVRSDFFQAEKIAVPLLGRVNARWPRSQIYNNFKAAETVQQSRRFFAPKQLFVIHNGINVRHFRSVPLASTGPVCIVGIGTLLPVKRWDRLLRAVLALKRREFDFGVRIVGGGPLRESLQQEAENLRISDRVEFIGHSDDIPGELARATFLVHTSDSEGFPNVVMEAMACGRTIVATDTGDVAFLVEDEKTGFVIRRGDEPTLVQRMASLIADRDLCRRMGEAGRVKVEREFGLDRLVFETLAAYRSAGWRDLLRAE